MATCIAWSCMRYTRNGLSKKLLYRHFGIGGARMNRIAFLARAGYPKHKREMSTSENKEDNQKEERDSTRPKSHSKKIEEILRIKPQKFELSFGEYIKLKNSVRTRQRLSGMPFAFLGLATSSVVSAYMFPEMFDATPENVQLIMGLDPLVFCGICGVVSAGAGYALGTQLFKVLWKVMNKNQAMMLLEREKDFLERIQKARFASFSKFEDDYYGESIKTVSDYRQWLRTQQKKAKADKKFAEEKEATEQKDIA